MNATVQRRPLLAVSITGLLLLAAVWGAASLWRQAQPVDETGAFVLVGDTHFLADHKDAGQLDPRSEAMGGRLVDVLNGLAGTEIPESAGGGKVLPPRGLVHAGDCIDTGDQAKAKARQTEWAAFVQQFGLTGKDGRLKMPVYEVHGNHDSVRGLGEPVQHIIERNKNRPGVTNVSKNGVHYSWDWGPVHFVNLGLIVGHVDSVERKRRYDALGSLDFLIADLKSKVGASGRPVVITHHVDMLRYSRPLPVEDKTAAKMEWDPADVKGFYDALRNYNVAAILYGHTHVRNVFRWDGTTKAAKEGIPVFNVAKASHFAGQSQALFYLEIRGNIVTAREYQTKDGWQTGSWTPQVWTAPVRKALAVP